jgi:hypothetical protein
MRTARSQTSFGYLFVVPILLKYGASGKLGAVQSDEASAKYKERVLEKIGQLTLTLEAS